MNDNPENPKEINKKISSRSILVQHDIYTTVYTSGASDRLFFNEIINALIAFCQAPVFFGVYEGELSDCRLRTKSRLYRKYSSSTDEVRSSHIQKILTKSCCYERDGFIEIIRSETLGKVLYFKLVRVIPDGENYHAVWVKKHSTSPIDQYIWRAVVSVTASKFINKRTPSTFNLMSQMYFFDSILESITLKKMSSPDLDIKNVSELNTIEAQRKWLKKTLPKSWKSVFKKIEISSDFIKETIGHSELSNYFIMARSYGTERYDENYSYNISLILDQHQLDKIEVFLSNLRILGKDGYRYRYFDEFDSEKKEHPNRAHLLKSLDDWFWKSVYSNDFREIIECYSESITNCSQSFSDVVFKSGVTYIRYPLESSGLYRIGNQTLNSFKSITEVIEVRKKNVHEKEKSEKLRRLELALKRAVTYHYILSAMAPIKDAYRQWELSSPEKSKSLQLVMVLNPIEVSGATFAVIGHLLYVDQTFALDDSEWYAKYNFITEIRRKVGRNIRRKLKVEHLRLVKNAYVKAFKNAYKRQRNGDKTKLQDIFAKESRKAINDYSIPLLSPYDYPVFIYCSDQTEQCGMLLQLETEKGIFVFNGKLMPSVFPKAYIRKSTFIQLEEFRIIIQRAWEQASLSFV